ncbi:MAG: TAXI family TRAP transporter solute-binding subunit [Rhizobiaceae bacterium]
MAAIRAKRRPTGSPANQRTRRRSLFVAMAVLAAVAIGGGWFIWRTLLAPPDEPITLVVGAGPSGTDAHALLREIAEVVERHSTRVRLKVRETRDSSESISLINQRQVDLAAVRADTPVVADVRLVARLYPDYFQFIVASGAPARSVNDLVGHRVAVPDFGTDAIRSFFVVADHYDLPLDRVHWKATSFDDARRGLLSGRYDALFTVRSLRDPELVRLFEDAQLKDRDLRYLPVRQAEAMALKRPFIKAALIPEGAFNGNSAAPTLDTQTAAIDRLLVTREDVDAEAVREFTAILFEHKLDIALRAPLGASIAVPDLAGGMAVALHDGAADYYDREKPSFLESNAEPIGLILTVAAMLVSALAALNSRFASGQKNRADRYNHQLLALDDGLDEIADAEQLAATKKAHSEILHAVVEALDADEIAEDGFQSFALLWQSVRDHIREREAEIRLR